MKNRFKYFLAIITALIFPVAANAANTISLVSVSVSAGETCSIKVQVDNTDAFVAFQADIPVPAGLSYVSGSALLNPSRVTDHALSASLLGSTLRLIAYSVSNTPFAGSTGTLITFSLRAGTVPGECPLTLSNTLLGNSSSQSLSHTVGNGSVTILGPNYQGSVTSIDFGRVALTTTGIQYINVQNLGNRDLIVSGITFTDGQFTSPESGGFTLSGGQNRQVSVIFAPTVKGTYAKQMKILSNDPDTPEASINIYATGFTVNELHTGSMTGASGTTARLEFTVNNMESFTGLQFDIILPSPLSLIPGSPLLSRQQDHAVMASMVSSGTLRVVAFSAAGQNFTGNDGKILSLDFTIDGTGGSYPITIGNVIIANSSEENVVSAWYNNTLLITSPDIDAGTSVDFGDVSILSQGHQNLTVYNYGQEDLVVNGLNFNSGYFTSTQILPVTISPGNNLPVPLVFTKNTKGPATCKLYILSNDPDEYPFVVNLSGNAFVPNYLTIGNYNANQGFTFQLAVEAENQEPFVAFQSDLDFPAGLTPDLNGIQLTDRKQDHVMASVLMGANTLRIIAWSPGQKAFTGTSGSLLTIPMSVDPGMTPGTYALTIRNGLLSNSLSENVLYGVHNGTVTICEYVPVNQDIALTTGWNIFSSPVLPQVTGMMNVIQTLKNDGSLVKIQDETGNSLENLGNYGGWTNYIGNIALTEGYKIKVTQDCQLTISGAPASLPLQIPLKAGWNLIGYPKKAEAEAKAVVQQLIDRGTLIKVQDEKGNSLEDLGAALGGWVNNIGNFKPGEGYKIKVNAADTLTIRESYAKSASSPASGADTVHLKSIITGKGSDH